MDTANGNSWKMVEKAVVARSAAEVLLLQEPKFPGEKGRSKPAARGAKLGWNCVATAAHRTAADRATGG